MAARLPTGIHARGKHCCVPRLTLNMAPCWCAVAGLRQGIINAKQAKQDHVTAQEEAADDSVLDTRQ
jgi:hypothetical protein